MSTAPLKIDDEYTGKLKPGGTPQRRKLRGATVIKASVGPMDNNAYLVTCTSTGSTVLIDAANEAERLVQLIDENVPELSLVVTTHQHPDHWQALEDVVSGFASPTAAHSVDAPELPVTQDRTLSNGDTVTVGELTFDVIHLRGHTPGSVALALERDGTTHLFTGDSLFPGGPGKTDDADAFETLITDLEERIFAVYDDSTIVYPGHGADTTLGAERPQLKQWRQRGW
ncbi:MAG: MBL fold metallo-hydrolase [Tomitella sp.]|nr:MBL fold metallo-hydrolase [Tomitella sp.]